MIVTRVPQETLPGVFRVVQSLLGPALQVAGDHDMTDALDKLKSREWRLWTAAIPGRPVGCAITEVVEYPQGRVLLIYAGGAVTGYGHAVVKAMVPILQAYGRRYDCRAMRWFGRPGWRRSGFLPPDARHKADVMEVVL